MRYVSTIERMAERKGRQEGRQEGLEEGRQEGLEEGRQEGLEEGRQEEGRCRLRLHCVNANFTSANPSFWRIARVRS